ncbi:uncharacterized protein ARMOST_12658 [Armillaria ostoyae]|uniref:Chromo domain-containing protein n=1 Tax=Armillaria ostoyae TaxID=47428 RepID=A0A284RKK4_ARMOS|nr:uncharacterized protein ARMOST_12658 [Armillaria ostoyae]
MILYGQNPHTIPDSPCPTNSKVPATSDFSKVMAKIHKETETTLEEAARRMKAQYDKHKCPTKEYCTGDLVWLDTTNLHLPRPKKKLDNKSISKLLTPYTPPIFPNQEQPPPPPPDLIDGEEQWELEEVLNSKTQKVHAKRGQPLTTVIDYFVKWKGWTREHNSWVAETDMGNAEEVIADYIKKTKRNERVAIIKFATPSSHDITMVLNHIYESNSDVAYLGADMPSTHSHLDFAIL